MLQFIKFNTWTNFMWRERERETIVRIIKLNFLHYSHINSVLWDQSSMNIWSAWTDCQSMFTHGYVNIYNLYIWTNLIFILNLHFSGDALIFLNRWEFLFDGFSILIVFDFLFDCAYHKALAVNLILFALIHDNRPRQMIDDDSTETSSISN